MNYRSGTLAAMIGQDRTSHISIAGWISALFSSFLLPENLEEVPTKAESHC